MLVALSKLSHFENSWIDTFTLCRSLVVLFRVPEMPGGLGFGSGTRTRPKFVQIRGFFNIRWFFYK
jgi:hypothetical protein